MEVQIRCFSHVRHNLGEEVFTLSLPDGSTTDDAERQVRERLPPSVRSQVFRLAVNQEFITTPTTLHDGDEVAVLPPMQGG